MGHSTDAYLYYGFDVYNAGEGLIKYYRKEVEPDKMLEGLGKSYWPHYSERMISDLLGVSIGTHCSGDYPIYYIYVTESWQFASRGYPQVVKQWPMENLIEFRDTLKNACENLGIDYDEEVDFKFRIASYED
jgi:hypothetical protein